MPVILFLREAEMIMSKAERQGVVAQLGAGVVVALAVTVGLAWAAGQVLNIQVRTTNLRERPSFLGTTLAEMSYGTKVNLVSRQGPWVQVTGPRGNTGWLHESALAEKELAMASGSSEAATGASKDEIALAGKGFTAEVEKEYRQQNKDLDFSLVDRMESRKITPEQAAAFLAAGQVTPSAGGR
jgi:hypothetical protein